LDAACRLTLKKGECKMDVFSVITLMGGLAFFLYGMHVLSSGLERMAGGALESLLRKMTSNRWKCLLLGAGITAAIQSSSAVTVMLVGLVNSGIMTIGQCIHVIMGSNIGTTLTAWILTLVGIESNSLLLRLMKPENFSLIFAFVGILFIMGSQHGRRREIGGILVGFAVLMYGMKLMSTAVQPLAELPAMTNLLTAFQNPVLGVLVGVLITAVLQSSSASIGMLQALALTGAVSYGAAIPIIMGQNIGTCVTALISSAGVSRNAKKVAVVHITFNVIGTAVCLSLYWIANAMFHLEFTDWPIDTVGIAEIHTAFNLLTTAMLLPFTKQLERFAHLILPETTPEEEDSAGLLDKRLLFTPAVALSECGVLTSRMAALAVETMETSLSILNHYEERQAEAILEHENTLDCYEDELGSYLVLLSSKQLSDADSLTISKMLHVIGDFERLGDHAVNLLYAARKLEQNGLHFSGSATQELSVLREAIVEILSMTQTAYQTNALDIAMEVEPLEQRIDQLVDAVKSKHIERLKAGACSIELGLILMDVLTNLERVSDHCSNIAVAVLELSHSSFDTHKYLNGIRSDNAQYKDAYAQFARKYQLQNFH